MGGGDSLGVLALPEKGHPNNSFYLFFYYVERDSTVMIILRTYLWFSIDFVTKLL